MYEHIFTKWMIAVFQLQYYDAEPPIKPHTYSHTSNVTLRELFYLRILPLVLINLMTPAKVAPDLTNVRGTWEEKHHHYIMFEADIQFRPLHTSILDIYKMFEPLVCCIKGIWVNPYTVTPAKLAPDLGILGPLWTVIIVPLRHGWGWYPSQTASHILIRHIQSVWDIVMLSQGHMVAPLYHYTGQIGPRFE